MQPLPAPRGRLAPTERLLDGLAARGIVPMLMVETDAGGGVPEFGLSTWSAGLHDDRLDDLVAGLGRWAGTMIVRIDQEMDGKKFPWAGHPLAFKRMWEYVASKIQREATQGDTLLHWCSTFRGGAEYYPGDEYVDYAGFTCYDSEGDGVPDITTKLRRAIEAQRAFTQRGLIASEVGIKRLQGNDRVRAKSLSSLQGGIDLFALALMDMDLRAWEPTNDWRITGDMIGAYRDLLRAGEYEAGWKDALAARWWL
jgi:hypothetical protein